MTDYGAENAAYSTVNSVYSRLLAMNSEGLEKLLGEGADQNSQLVEYTIENEIDHRPAFLRTPLLYGVILEARGALVRISRTGFALESADFAQLFARVEVLLMRGADCFATRITESYVSGEIIEQIPCTFAPYMTRRYAPFQRRSLLELMLKYGANPNAELIRLHNGRTTRMPILKKLLTERDLEASELLLNNGADTNIDWVTFGENGDEDTMPMLTYLMIHGFFPEAELLLRYGAEAPPLSRAMFPDCRGLHRSENYLKAKALYRAYVKNGRR